MTPSESPKPKIYLPEQQIELVKGVEGLDDYQELYKNLFYEDPEPHFPNFLRNDLPFSAKPPKEFYQLMALSAVEGAQFGYDSMAGYLVYHYKESWKLPAFHPKHVLATIRYIADANEQSLPLKKRWEEIIGIKDPQVALGIWRSKFTTHNGIVSDVPSNVGVSNMASLAELKLREASFRPRPIPILLPTKTLNSNLAAIGFDHFLAENMRPDVFDAIVYPRVEHTLDGVIDPTSIFHPGMRRFYLGVSFPTQLEDLAS